MIDLSQVGICCDVDGTLYPVSKWRVAWRLRKHLGLLRAMHRTREKMRTSEASFATHHGFLEAEAGRVAEALGMSKDRVMRQLAELKFSLADVMTKNTKPFPGARESLNWAIQQGAAVAVLSDYPPQQKLSNLGLDRVSWSGCFAAEECGALKPNSPGFQTVRASCGQNIRTWIYIGDRQDTDVLGAQSSGFVPVLFSSRESGNAAFVLKDWNLAAFQGVIGEILRSEP
uniref:Predicted hydrolase (HAD superfamily) n=1 Tax=uncultured myxobacterium HF0070_11L13 TaxID=723554 RepID=E7C1Z5_9BACT|nr:predicted hydrolase (HAD superfamily) [uncultured myxobacterium HF0070_11L13]